MGIKDGLDMFGSPALALPEDIGDGPFASAIPNDDIARPAMANTETLFRRERRFEESLLTRGSDTIAVGQIYINDTVPPNSFRRVHQHFSMRSVRHLDGNALVRFWGDPMAIIEEGTGQLAPGPEGDTSIQRALETLDGVNALARPTMSFQTSSYQIRFRLPGYEPVDSSGHPNGIRNIDDIVTLAPGFTPPAGDMLAANRIETFPFGNSGGFIKEFDLEYQIGNVVPLIFDIVNHNPIYAIQAALSVFVLLDRTEE